MFKYNLIFLILMPMSGMGITAKCRQCGQNRPTTEFTLDPIIGAMVCAACSKERKTKESTEQMRKKQAQIEAQVVAQQQERLGAHARPAAPSTQPAAPAKNRPAGWDAEDEYLDKLAKAKQNNVVITTRIDKDPVMYKCQKCQYDFAYNVEKQKPSRCPFCNSPIFKFAIRE